VIRKEEEPKRGRTAACLFTSPVKRKNKRRCRQPLFLPERAEGPPEKEKERYASSLPAFSDCRPRGIEGEKPTSFLGASGKKRPRKLQGEKKREEEQIEISSFQADGRKEKRKGAFCLRSRAHRDMEEREKTKPPPINGDRGKEE